MRLRALLGCLVVTGCHAGGGPVVAYRVDDGARFGWEAKGGWGLASTAIGQTFSVGEGEDTIFHAAWEPGAVLGASLGLDVTSSEDVGFLRGAWLGAPVLSAPPATTWSSAWSDGPGGRDTQVAGMHPFLSIAIGYRYVHGPEIYIAPKYFLLESIRLAH